MQDYKELFVGQIFKSEEDEPSIKVLEIDKGLAAKYPNLSSSGAQHGIDEGIDVRWSQDGEESISDYIDFIDYTYSNCFDPNKKSPNGTGDMEPVYKREEDEEENECPCEQYEPIPGWDVKQDVKQEVNEWPLNNKVGYCWCGHSIDSHPNIADYDDLCRECQCVSFALDRWGTKIV